MKSLTSLRPRLPIDWENCVACSAIHIQGSNWALGRLCRLKGDVANNVEPNIM